MHIAMPSKGRPSGLSSLEIIPNATVYVSESELEDYERAGLNNVVAVPSSIRGITPTRNWILDHCNDRHVVMVDDDVKAAGWIEMFPEKCVHRKLREREWTEIWARLFEVTEQLKLAIWGVATHSAPQACYPQRPFLFHTYVTASCMGIINDGRTRFDESYVVKEDYELCLRCLERDGAVVGARFCYWENHHWENEGGCRDYRTQQVEEETIERLVAKYGRYIRRVVKGGSRYSIELDF